MLGMVGNDSDDASDGGEPKASLGRPQRQLTGRLSSESSSSWLFADEPPGEALQDGPASSRKPWAHADPITIPPPSTPLPESSRRPGLRRREPFTVPPPAAHTLPDKPESSRRAGAAARVRGAVTMDEGDRTASEPMTIPPPSAGPPPSSRRAGAPPSSRRPSPESDRRGQVHRLVTWCDAHKGSFFISLLIMQTGIKLRDFDGAPRDERAVLAKVWPALDLLLTSAEIDDLRRALRYPW